MSSETPARNPDELISLPECQSAVGSVLAALEGRRIDAALIRNIQQSLGGMADQTDLIREGAREKSAYLVHVALLRQSSAHTAAAVARDDLLAGLQALPASLRLEDWRDFYAPHHGFLRGEPSLAARHSPACSVVWFGSKRNLFLSEICHLRSTLYLAAWTSGNKSESEQEHSVFTYFLISISTALANCVQAILLTVCALFASHGIHRDMLQKAGAHS